MDDPRLFVRGKEIRWLNPAIPEPHCTHKVDHTHDTRMISVGFYLGAAFVAATQAFHNLGWTATLVGSLVGLALSLVIKE